MSCMPARPILELGNPALWQASGAVETPASVRGLIEDLSDTLAAFREAHGFGRGIAAPQLGVHARVIFIRMPGGFTGPLINPRIEWSSAEQMELWDDCFSLPGLMVRVARAARIEVSYLDEHGSARTIRTDGDGGGAFSELLQHEIDHLDGILAVQRAISPQALCTRAEWERRYLRP
jgi:peptide deformylase